MAMSINNAPLSPSHPYFLRQNCSVQGGAAAGPMRILFLPTKMCHPQCRDEERCAENHSNDHNFALETIQMPSFWEHTRLDVPHVPGVATRVSTRSIGVICHIDPHAAPPADAAGQPPDTPRTPPDTQGATSLLSRIPLYFSILSWGSETRIMLH